MEQKRMLRSKQSVIGRINTRQLQIEQEEKHRLLEEQAALQAMLLAEGSSVSTITLRHRHDISEPFLLYLLQQV